MTIQTHSPQCWSFRHLETALQLYFEESYYCAITLAGVADEILGKILQQRGCEPSLVSLDGGAKEIHKELFDEDLKKDPEEKGHPLNRVRNTIKHALECVPFDAKAEAKDMLDRAIDNYYSLHHDLTPAMQRFQDLHVGNNAAVRELLPHT